MANNNKLVILVCSMSAVGHVNSCAGALSKLRDRGHRIVFVLEEAFGGKYIPQGFEEYVFVKKIPPEDNGEKAGEKWMKVIREYKMIGPEPPIEKVKALRRVFSSKTYRDDVINMNEAIKDAIDLYKPDLIYFDNMVLYPAIPHSGIPWIKNESYNPTYQQFDDELSPGGSGFPLNGDRSNWCEFNKVRQTLTRSKSLNDIFESLGYDRYEDDIVCLENQILTVYGYPEELNYPAIREKGWFNLEMFNKPTSRVIVDLAESVPRHFLDSTLDGKFSGKLIYLSMGSLGSIDLALMKRLVEVLSKTNHKYIVSKGILHQQYELAPNMWGDGYLPQLKILPHVDLVITHGGNNTVTETFIEGKPMIVMPIFMDQFDNAQRIAETDHGTRVDAYNFKDEELIDAVESLLNNHGLKSKLKVAADRILATERHETLADKIEQLFSK